MGGGGGVEGCGGWGGQWRPRGGSLSLPAPTNWPPGVSADHILAARRLLCLVTGGSELLCHTGGKVRREFVCLFVCLLGWLLACLLLGHCDSKSFNFCRFFQGFILRPGFLSAYSIMT